MWRDSPYQRESVAAKKRPQRQALRKLVRQQPLINKIHVAPRTRARAARRAKSTVGIIHLMSAASLLGSQYKKKRYRHLFGMDLDPRYAPAFSKNNGGAPLIEKDLLLLSDQEFRALLKKYNPRGPRHCQKLLFLITLDCSRASKANGSITKEQKIAWYRKALTRVNDLLSIAGRKHTVFAFHEFLADEDVMALILNEFPEISKTVLDGHFYEDRKRAYFTQRYDRGAAAFLNEFKKLKRRHRGGSVADALREMGRDVPPGTEMFTGCRTTIADRLAGKGRDPTVDNVYTITRKGIYIHVPVADPNSKLPPVEEILLDPKETLHLRSRGRDFPFELVASDTLETKDLIVAMGVSLVVGAAAQRSFDRCVE